MKERIVYIIFIILCLLLGLSIKVRVAEASILDWFKTEEVIAYIEPVKTIDSEIDRLSIKYEVSSSTVRSIIKCESNFNPDAINHNLYDGVVWSSDLGLFQVNNYYHEKTMTNLGLDIHNQWDSLEYGFILMKEQGVKPWKASSKCWTTKLEGV